MTLELCCLNLQQIFPDRTYKAYCPTGRLYKFNEAKSCKRVLLTF